MMASESRHATPSQCFLPEYLPRTRSVAASRRAYDMTKGYDYQFCSIIIAYRALQSNCHLFALHWATTMRQRRPAGRSSHHDNVI